MSDLGYYLIGIVFVFLIIGIGAIEHKYDKQFRVIQDKLGGLKNEVEELEGRYFDLDDRITNLESD
jgi:hypothetical protein